MLHILASWFLSALCFLVLTILPIGVRLDSFTTALKAAFAFGVLNAFLNPILQLLSLPITILTLGFFSLVVNAAIFGLSAWMIRGFDLRYGFWSALFGSIGLTLIHATVRLLFAK